jgi:hypothetical protein
MSRFYQMDLEITGVPAAKLDALENALDREWEWAWDSRSHWDKASGPDARRHVSGQSSLASGRSEKEFAAAVNAAIAKAMGGTPTKVSVKATYLEDLPFECFDFANDGSAPEPSEEDEE